MSDAATNPDRRLFTGLRDNDLVAFINVTKIFQENGVVMVLLIFFLLVR